LGRFAAAQPSQGSGAPAPTYNQVVPVGANPIPYLHDQGLAEAADALGNQAWAPGSGIEENQGAPYLEQPRIVSDLQKPLDPGINTPSYLNPYRTVMYAISGLSTTLPLRALTGNSKRTYLMVQNLGPGNLFVGIGVDPNAGGGNVLNLVSSQVYEQIGGGVYIPPIQGLFDIGLSLSFAFCSPEYISLLTDTAGTAAMIVEGQYNPPPIYTQAGQQSAG
jgi:hypothetical protein